ncbi:dihydroorotate dehydrogenase B (NAD(+)) electron transfer subunit [Clostridium sp. CAG:411]|mgnify:FL=1|jgi:dihydroorotate dehydrogenase electron transfer subunit|nr:dihydroorotate dehydrogenase electron transfer subunit [Lachnospiraceae bacterium]CDE44199.1 dihydroorotate dehydrogenase B (NAD(+)) electron transfer subunit [Clostridium sp. CAG:411]
MSDKVIKNVVITSMVKVTDGIYSMWIKDKDLACNAKPGQFVSLYCKEGSQLLPRPISICEIDRENETLRLVYRVVGKGTKEFSKMNAGDTIRVMGPLGNGFTLEGKKAILIGGGIGIPPMLELAKSLDCEVQVVLGYRNNDLFLKDEFTSYGKVIVSTEDGSVGTKGNVIDAIREKDVQGDIIFACGPTPMLRGVKAYAQEKGLKAQLSLEEKMACGIGACLACVCQSKEVDSHTHVKNKRICKDGPVFYAEEVEL